MSLQDIISYIYRTVKNNEIGIWIVFCLSSAITILGVDRESCTIPSDDTTAWVWSGLKTLVGSTAKFGQDLVCVNNKASIRFFGILGLTFGALGLASYTIRKITNNHRVSAFLHVVAFGMTAYIYSPPADEFQIYSYYIENYLLKKLISGFFGMLASVS